MIVLGNRLELACYPILDTSCFEQILHKIRHVRLLKSPNPFGVPVGMILWQIAVRENPFPIENVT